MNKFIATLMIFCSVWLTGCSDDYYTDGGILDNEIGKLNTTTMGYLESKPAQFDTLTKLIHICGLVNDVNKQGNTFFVPQDYSIHNYFELIFPEGKWPQLSELTEEEIEEITQILKNYIIPNEEVVREKLSPTYSFGTTLGSKKARYNLVREDYLGNVNMGASWIMYSLDTSTEEQPRERFQSARVVTSGLRSTNGIVHVLVADSHIFGFK